MTSPTVCSDESHNVAAFARSLAANIPQNMPRAAFVSGAAKRVGRETALALGQAGFSVAVHYRHSALEAEMTAEEIRSYGVEAVTLAGDISCEDELPDLLDRATTALGPIGVLINNASTFARDSWSDTTAESWHFHIAPNLRAPFVLTQRFAQLLPQTARGVVINMLDARVWAPTGRLVSYALSKSGLWALTQSLALALAPRIRVNGIGPGPTLPSTHETLEAFARDARSLPLGHGTSPGEIARAILAILALPSMTGQMLALDGGQHLARQQLALDEPAV